MRADELAQMFVRAAEYHGEGVRVPGCIRTSHRHFGQEFTVATPDATYLVIVSEIDADDTDEPEDPE